MDPIPPTAPRPSSSVVEAKAPRCPSCGAPLPVDLVATQLRCHSCGASTPLDPRLRASLRAYVGDVASFVRAELDARFEAAFYAQNEKATTLVVYGVVGFAIFLTGGFMAWAILRQIGGGLPLAYAAPLVLGWLASLGAFARGWGVMHDIPSVESLAVTEVLRCDRCGAIADVTSGHASRRCAHCTSDLLVPCDVAGSLLGASREATETARTKRARDLDRAVRAGDRTVRPAVLVVVVVSTVSVACVVILGRPSGPEVSLDALCTIFGVTFVVALFAMGRATRGAMRQRAAVDATIAAVTARAREVLEGTTR